MSRRVELAGTVRAVCQVAVILVPLVFSSRVGDPVFLPKAAAIVFLWLCAAAVVGFSVYRGDVLPIPPRPFLLAISVFLGLAAIAAGLADSMGRGVVGAYGRWSGLALYVACAGFALVAASYFVGRTARSLLYAMAIGTALVAVYGALQRAGLDPIAWSTQFGSKIPSTLGNPNFAAAYVGLGVPIWAWIAFDAQRRGLKIGAVGVVLLHVLVTLWTGSLQGPLTAGIGLFVLAYVWSRAWDSPATKYIRGGLVAVVTPGVGTAILGYAGRGPLRSMDWSTVDIRVEYWRAAVLMFREAPLVGHGFGGYEALFRRYRSLEAWEFGGSNLMNNAPHNVVFEMLVHGGVLLMVAYLAVLVISGWSLIRAVLDADRQDLGLVGVVAAVWAGYVGQLMFSIDVPPLALIGWLTIGLAIAVRSSGHQVASLRGVSRRSRSFLKQEAIGAAALLVLSGIAGYFMVVQAAADANFGGALRRAEADPSAAYEQLERAEALAPWEPRYVRQKGELLLLNGEPFAGLEMYEGAAELDKSWWDAHILAGRLAYRLGELERSAMWFERAIRIDPIAPEIKAEFAEVEIERGNAQRSVDLLEDALALQPERAEWWVRLGEALDATGDSAGAVEARCRALELDASLDSVECPAGG